MENENAVEEGTEDAMFFYVPYIHNGFILDHMYAAAIWTIENPKSIQFALFFLFFIFVRGLATR